ncbi:unnamed protein product [Meloidogyne enterolobii]|uniref:Uncharacterized protein n=1 Tax=Meloidogyne enterolobii TaxID=390850 RepID=A0ACB0XLP8_MELEN
MLHRKRTCNCGKEMRKEKRGQNGRWICKKSVCSILWQKLKRRHKTEFGTVETTFESYMNEFVWKQKFGGDDCFFHLISQITNNQKYLCE